MFVQLKNIVLFICIHIRAKSIFFAGSIIFCDQSGQAILIENNICNLPRQQYIWFLRKEKFTSSNTFHIITSLISYEFYLLLGWPFGPVLCKVTPYLQGVSVCASVNTLAVIAIDRQIHRSYPVHCNSALCFKHIGRTFI